MTELERQVKADGLLRAGRPVVVLYSGGRDSTCLLDLAVTIAGQDAVRALHVNYGLRGTAAADERHCRRTADALGVALTVHLPAAPPEAGNVQAWARAERYQAAERLARSADGRRSGPLRPRVAGPRAERDPAA